MKILLGLALALAQTANAPSFEVASIREHVLAGPNGRCEHSSVSGNRVTIPCQALRILIMRAYNVQAYQISGGPEWLTRVPGTLYDVTARAPGEGTPSEEQIRGMLQTLLADRFQLKLHRETKELPVYALVVGKNGPKFKESAADTENSLGFGMGGVRANLTASAESMSQYAVALSREAGRPVIDKTGLTGKYDITLEWSRAQSQVVPGVSPPTDSSVAPDTSGPSLFTAVQEQLGLRLESEKAPVEFLVIDHAERPSEN